MIRYVVYFLRIFKIFHGLMNNPVLLSVACLVLPHFAILSHKRHDFRDFFNKRLVIRFSL